MLFISMYLLSSKNHKNSVWIIFFVFLISNDSCTTYRSDNRQKTFKVSKKQHVEIPYRVFNKTYYPLKSAANFSQEGIASWYGPGFHGQLTSNKEVYNMQSMTAAHKTLPFDTRVRIINLENGLETVVRINDRGPFVGDRIIDLSHQAAKQLDMIEKGTARVRLIALKNANESNHLNEKSSTLENFSVQIGIFKDQTNALRLAQEVDNSRAEPHFKGVEKYFRVLVGNYSEFDNALEQMDELHAQGYPQAFIVTDK